MTRSQGQATLPLAGPPCQSTTIDTCDHMSAIRKAVSDEGWGVDALGTFMHRDKSLISRTLNGDRPTLNACRFILSLPLGVQRRLASAWGRHLGLIVIEPDIDQETASRHVLGGLVFMLHSMSASTEAIVQVIRGLSSMFGSKRMARASLPDSAEKKEIA